MKRLALPQSGLNSHNFSTTMTLTDKRPYTDQIPACFGKTDYEFALHESDLERARNMVACAILSGVKMSDLEIELLGFMQASGHGQPHIQKQIDRFRSIFLV